MTLFASGGSGTLPLFREAGMDFSTGEILLGEAGDVCPVFGKEAVKVWVWRALQPGNARFLYSAHTGSYGHRLDGLAGLALPEAESRMAGMVREALLVCPYITGVEGFSFEQEGSLLRTRFTVRTVYGDVTGESEAEA